MKQFSLQYISSFCMSIHLSMGAGISVSEGVMLFTQEENDSGRKAVLTAMHDALEIGEPLAGAIEKCGAFPRYMIDMTEVGERTGKLDDTLLALARYYERQDQLSKSIRSAVTYPAMLLAMLLLVLVIFIVQVLPIFYGVYQQLGSDAQMSGFAMGAMNVGLWIGQNWIPILIAVVVLAVLLVVMRSVVVRFFRRVFMGGALGTSLSASRFSGVMAMAMSSGMDMTEALGLAERLMDEPAMKEKVRVCADKMAQGDSFSECVAQTGIFTPLYTRMIAIGIKTGNADKVMDEIARRSGDEASDRLEAFVGKIEPTLVIIMSALVGVLLLSVMLPLAGIMSVI